MDSDRLRGRITDQFSYRGDRSDVWGAFDLFLDTDAYLNLGYSRWYQSHLVGSCQRRLATKIGRTLSAHLPSTDGARLLDVGCGRGGPAIYFADAYGFDVTGLDLVPYNVARARENARDRNLTRDLRVDAEFVVGDATRPPIVSGSMTACTAVDALVYVPEREAVLAEFADVLEPGGVVVLSDLVVRQDTSADARERVDRFAAAWDMPPLGTVRAYERALSDAGLEVIVLENLTTNSVGRFRKWTTLFDLLYATPAGTLLDRFLGRRDLDPTAIVDQIRRAHDALPDLQHALVVARK